MSILMSPSNNTGWGCSIGTGRIRGTGVVFTPAQPVRVRSYYRAQWGQKTNRTPYKKIRRRLKMYTRLHRQRLKADARQRRMSRAERTRRTREAVARIKRANRARRGAAVLVEVPN
uniref:PVII n=1 Tax=white-throated monitor adenovirus 1 TaxID=1631552 RepID=A0A0H3VBK0_9ADEN|nr:pVII [white-throated monitor adenovirus 1]